jgi:hypothetical protein
MKGFPIWKGTDHNIVAPQSMRNDSGIFFSGKISTNNEYFHSKKGVGTRKILQKSTYYDKKSLYVNIKNLLD